MLNRLTAVALAFTLAVSAATAQTHTWTGNAANWNNAASWLNGLPSSASTTNLVLTGTTQTNTTNDLPSPFTVNSLTMEAAATNGFVVNGGHLTFAGSSSAITRNLTDPTAAALVLNSQLTISTATTIEAGRNNTGSFYEVILGGRIGGSGNLTHDSTLESVNNDTLFRGANGTFTGTYTNTRGISYFAGANVLGRGSAVSLGTANALGSGIRLGSVAAAGQGVTDSSANQQFGSLSGGGANTTLTLGASGTANPATAMVGFSNTNTTFSGVISGAAASSFVKVGTGTLTLNGTAASSVSGTVQARDGVINLTGSTGTIAGFSNAALSVYAGAEIRQTMTGTGTNGRFANAGAISLNGGTLRMDASGLGASGTGYSDTVGAVNVRAGQSTVRIDTSAVRGARFNFASLSNATSSTGTVTFLSNSLGLTTLDTTASGNVNVAASLTSQLVGTNTTYSASAKDIAILTYGTGGTTTGGVPTTFVTFDGGANNSIRGLGTDNYDVNFDTATSNVSLSTTALVGSNATTNAVRLTAGGAVNLTGANTLTVTAGALLNNGGGDVTGSGTLVFGASGARTAYITTNNAMGISTAISAANLSKNGAGNLTLTGATTLTGTAGNTVAVNAGTLTLGAGSSVATTNALSSTNTLTYQVSRGAALDATANGLTVGNFTTLSGGGTAGTGGVAANQARVIGNVAVASGGTITPSALGGSSASLLSPGTLTVVGDVALNGGSTYVWATNSSITNGDNGAAPTAGTLNNYKSEYTASLLSVSGDLNLNGADAGNRVTLKLTSLTLANELGALYDVVSDSSRSWVLIEAGSITGFSADKFTLDTSAFSGLDTTRLSVSQVGNSLVLTFTPVPEPASLLAVCGAVTAGGLLWRRLRRKPAADATGVAA